MSDFNIVVAHFGHHNRVVMTDTLYQYDYGQQLKIEGITALPQTFQAHFSNVQHGGVSITVTGINGMVDVPNSLLMTGKRIYCWIYVTETGSGETVYQILMPVQSRPMPEYYDVEDVGVFDSVVNQVAGYAATATTAATSATASATAAAGSETAAAASASAAADSAENAAASEANAEASASAAQASDASAATAATTATAKAAEAAQSATSAGSAADRAEAAQGAAETAQEAAETAATSATADAATATTKATAAAASATTASTKATDATNAATTATAQAAAAEAAKTTAVEAKTAAQSAQSAAETAATTATAKATEAAASATAAAQAAASINTPDSALSGTSTNAVQNKVITGELTDVKTALDLLTFVDVAGKNLYDNANPTILNGFLSSSGLSAGQSKFVASSAAKCLVFPVEAETQYTLSNTNNLGRFSYAFSTSIPANNDIIVNSSALSSNTVTENGRKYATFTTPAGDDGYIILYYYNSNDGVAEDTIRATVMLTKGSDRIPFEPYQNEKAFRVIKNDLNGTGAAGQALMLDEDGVTLIWGTPTADVEIGDGTVTYPKLNAYLQNKVDQIGAITTETGVGAFHAEMDAASLGAELLDGTGWTGTGWTGDFANGFTPSVGADPLVREITGLVPGGLYRFTITTSNAHTNGYSDFYVSLGGSATFQTYKGGGASVSYEFGLVAGSSDSNLTITAINNYTGTITAMSLKAVSNLQTPAVIVSDTDDMPTAQILTGKDDLASIYFGLQSGVKAFFAKANTAFGVNTLKAVTDGFWNSAFGMNALADCIHGSRNVAIGFIALQHCVTGDRNIAVGSFALNGLTSGRGNVAIGADAMQTANGNYGIGIGVGANGGSGDENIAIGRRAGNASGQKNAILGSFAMESASSAGFNVAVGYQAAQESTGNYNVNVGAMAGKNSTSGNNNILIGYNAQKPAATDSNTIVIGGSNHNQVIIAGKVINFNQDGTVTWSELS